MTRIWVSGVVSLCLVAAGAAAQTPVPLTVDEAVARAVAEAPRLAEARARESAAASAVASKEALRAPTVTASSSYLRTNHVDAFGIPQADGSLRVLFPDIPSNYRARAELDVPIYTAGRAAAAVDAARADARAAAADTRTAEADVRLDVVRAYWTLVTSRESVRAIESTLQRMDAYVNDIRARLNAGFLPPNDLQSAQAQRARENVQLIQARNAAALAELDLDRLLGLELGAPITATTPVDQAMSGAADAIAQSPAALVARAREGRAERSGLQNRQAAWRSTADVAAASTRPQVGGLAAVQPARPNERFVPRLDEWKTSWDLGVSVNWPLWDGGRARADRAASLAQADALGHRLDDLDRQIAVEIRQRLLDLEAGRAALQAAGEAVAAATEARRVVGERFNAGVATTTDVLEAQNALLQADLERTQIAAGLRLGEARLLRAIGAL